MELKIIKQEIPNLTLLINETGRVLDVQAFLRSIISTDSNPYLSVLEPVTFAKVYAQDDKLIWPEAIETTVCNGEVQKHAAVFTAQEIVSFLLKEAE